MMILVTYDVNTKEPEGQARLRHVSKICMNYGQRVQYSVFECIVTPAQATLLESEIKNVIDHKHDSVRIYRLGSDYTSKIKHIGAKKPLDLDAPLVF